MKPKLGISDKNRAAIVARLNALLADEYTLYTKTRNYHWHVTGPNFEPLHKFFEAQYTELNNFIDEIAERAITLGGRAVASHGEFVKLATLKENAAKLSDGKMLADLLADHEAVVRRLREGVDETAKLGDAGTSDFLTGLLEAHEKMAWMLRAQLD